MPLDDLYNEKIAPQRIGGRCGNAHSQYLIDRRRTTHIVYANTILGLRVTMTRTVVGFTLWLLFNRYFFDLIRPFI